MMRPTRHTIVVVLAILSATCAAEARDYYVTPQGAADRTGADFDHAMSRDDLTGLLAERVEPGDHIRLGSGDYFMIDHKDHKTITFARSGRTDAPILVEGVDTGAGLPRIVGQWSDKKITYHAHSYCALSFAPGASYIQVRHLRIAGYMQGVTTNADHVALEFDDLAIENVREGFSLEGVADSTFRNCSITHYVKRGFRFEKKCHDLTLSHITADATAGEPDAVTENFPIGFSIQDDASNHDIAYDHCVARNNQYHDDTHAYWNGDGFCCESSPRRISYRDCASFDNTDGGWDDKSLTPTLVNCVAARNKRNFRLWNVGGDADHPAKLTNCLGVASLRRGGIGSSVGLWTCGAVVAERCTFADNMEHAVAVENNKHAGNMTLRRCILSSATAQKLILQESDTQFSAEETVMFTPSQPGEGDPQFVAPAKDWSGEPANAFDSRRYPERGYVAP